MRPAFSIIGLIWLIFTPLANASGLETAQLLSLQKQDAAALQSLWETIPATPKTERRPAMLFAADLCQRYGLTEIARSYYLQALTEPASTHTAMASGDRLAIGSFFAAHQEWQRLSASLENHWRDFPYLLKSQALNLLSLEALADSTPSTVSTLYDSESRKINHRDRFLQYNYAVALYQQGKAFEARQQLHALIELPVFKREEIWLRDEVRIRLAQHYLYHQQGKLAAPLLDAIRAQSPYAARALLLSGWAGLTPDAEQPLCSQAKSGQVCWIETDQQGRDIQRSPSSISQTFAELRKQMAGDAPQTLQAALNNSIKRWQLASQLVVNEKQVEERQAQLEALVSIGYAQQLVGEFKSAKQSYQRALTALKAQTKAAMNAAEQQQRHLLGQLDLLEKQFLNLSKPNPALQERALAAIGKAKQYRRQDAKKIQRQQQTQWDERLTEYLKQAHLGLASTHHQLSVQ